MKVYCASMTHESNSFSPLPTNLDSFREGFLYRPSTGEGGDLFRNPPLEGNLRSIALDRGYEVVDGLHAGATPSAPTGRRDYLQLRDEMVDRLADALPVDMVLLFLHGAQMAEGCDDCEGDILRRLRGIVGPGVPIGVELDLHCNITRDMVENASVIIACKEYPHTDFGERATELVNLIAAAAETKIQPVTAFRRVPMLGFFHTTREPMRSFVDSLAGLEGKNGILSVSLAHGFPAADFPETGAGVLVVANNDKNLADDTAAKIARQFFALRREISAPGLSVGEALDRALAADGRTVVIADASDNPGGGAAGDSTHFLRAILDRKIPGSALATIWDPAAYDLIARAGEDERLALRIGGKSGPLAGAPVDADARVIRIRDDLKQIMFGEEIRLGPAASIRIGDVEVIVAEQRQQVFSPNVFEELGIDISSRKLVILKSAQHFYTQFAPVAAEVIYASPPGSISTDFKTYPYSRIERPIWPLDEAPFSAFGNIWED